MRRLLVVYNPNSSNYVRVKNEVLEKLPSISGFMIGKFIIEKAPFEDNVKRLKKVLEDGDVVLSAGGDATAAVSANAILESGKDVTLSVLPYGNFNDLARTLRTFKFDDILNSGFKSTNFYPLDVIVDGKHWRYACCYVTIGMTAEAVELFDNQKIRKKLQKGHKSSWRSYIYLVTWYFKNRRKKVFIPEFKLNGELQHKKTSDYAAVNGRSMSRVMKGGDDFLKPEIFRSETDRLATNFWRLTKLMTKSVLSRVPGKDTKGDTLEFVKPATVSLQAEGEYKTFENANKIEIRKPSKCLKVILN
ncbi:hypothetical protein IJI89_01935 [Candidatus Saccharibacteria bacterium]|nr:hypothetical protein [Candidatus Saccharibacteria bacterium]